MNCSRCNNEISENSNFCNVCGAPVDVQGNVNNSYANVNQQYSAPQYGQPNNQHYNQQYNQYQPPYGQAGYQPPYGYNPMPNPNDTPSVGLNILSFLIPIVGLVLYLVWKDQYPRKAKSAGKTALISFIINLVITFLFWILWIVFVAVGAASGAFYI